MSDRISTEMGLCSLIREVCSRGETENKGGSGGISISRLFNKTFQESPQYKFAVNCKQEIECLLEAEKQLDIFLLDACGKEKIKNCLESVRIQRGNLLSRVNPSAPFPDQKDIERYLTSYKQLLKAISSQIEVFEDSYDLGEVFFQNILNIDIFLGNQSWASLYSPASLESLLHIYDYVEQYIKEMTVMEIEEEMKSLLQANYQGVIISKALRHFRWLLSDGNTIYQAALPASLPETKNGMRQNDKSKFLDIPIRRLQDYSSYEGIGELRLFDKIIYELGRKELSGNESYRILIIGDLLKKPIETLGQTVEKYFAHKIDSEGQWKKIKKLNIYITVLTKNDWNNEEISEETSEKISVKYFWKKYDGQLCKKIELDSLIEKNDLMFILDSCDLYREFFVDPLSADYIKQEINTIEWSDIAEGQERFYTLLYSGYPGIFMKEINQTLLEYFSRKLKDTGLSKKSVYIYISDLEAISGLDYFDAHFIRVERYNEKEFLILRMSYAEKPLLQETRERKIIVLNLWQVIKHSMVRNINRFIEQFGVGDISSGITTFRDTLIGVEYDEWPEKLKFSYCFPESYLEGIDSAKYEQRVIKWIKQGIMPYFKDGKNGMFYEYFIKTFNSFLYSDAKCVDDMLFLHLFTNRHELLKEVSFEGECKIISNYRSKLCKYSQKQFYLMAMEDYDTSSETFPSKYRKLDLMERADYELRKTIFQKIKAACERNQYTESYLYANCLKMI